MSAVLETDRRSSLPARVSSKEREERRKEERKRLKKEEETRKQEEGPPLGVGYDESWLRRVVEEDAEKYFVGESSDH